MSDNSHETHILSSTFPPGLLLLEGRLRPFPFLALGNEDGLRPSGPLMLPGAATVPGSRIQQVQITSSMALPSAGAFPIVTSVGILIPLEGAMS